MCVNSDRLYYSVNELISMYTVNIDNGDKGVERDLTKVLSYFTKNK